MATQFDLGSVQVEVVRKAIKNVHLSVLPPRGRVRVAVPLNLKLETIRVFVISRLAWIKAQQRKMQAQEREMPRSFLTRETHHVWGRRCLLERSEKEEAPRVELKRNRLLMQVRPGSDEARCAALLDAWYREQIRAAVPALVAKWEPVMGVQAGPVYVQRMKTKWGSCNPASRSMRLNTDLAKKPPECLEYIVVHEMVHLIEPTHNARFTSLMDLFLPNWQHLRAMLNRLPVRHEEWDY